MAKFGVDWRNKSAWVVIGDASIPLYWKEPHQFIAGLSIVGLGAYRSRQMDFDGFLGKIGHGEGAEWMSDLDKSGLVEEVHGTLRETGLDAGSSSPVGSRHQFQMCRLLYAICRSARPETIVETGVGAGTSSAFILQALSDNGGGELHSIERVKMGHTGILVSDRLRGRWDLIFGKSSDKLPELLRDKEVDIFLHDSEHTNRNMLWEYHEAWPRIRGSGYLLSDDIVDNFAFLTFASRAQTDLDVVVDDFGILRKGVSLGET